MRELPTFEIGLEQQELVPLNDSGHRMVMRDRQRQTKTDSGSVASYREGQFGGGGANARQV